MTTNSYRRMVDKDGRTVLIPQDDGAGHKNPPLPALNNAARHADKAMKKAQQEERLEDFHTFQRQFKRGDKNEKRHPVTPPRPEYHGTAVPK